MAGKSEVVPKSSERQRFISTIEYAKLNFMKGIYFLVIYLVFVSVQGQIRKPPIIRKPSFEE